MIIREYHIYLYMISHSPSLLHFSYSWRNSCFLTGIPLLNYFDFLQKVDQNHKISCILSTREWHLCYPESPVRLLTRSIFYNHLTIYLGQYSCSGSIHWKKSQTWCSHGFSKVFITFSHPNHIKGIQTGYQPEFLCGLYAIVYWGMTGH